MAFRPVRGWHAPDSYPDTEFTLRHLYKNRDRNGLAPAFVKIQGRVLFDPDRLQEIIAGRASGTAA